MITAFGHSESTKTIITSGKSEPPPGITAREESESSTVYFSMKQKRVMTLNDSIYT